MNLVFIKALKASFAGLVLLPGVLSLPSVVSAAPSYVVVGYAPGWNSNPSYNFAGNFPTDIPWSRISHIYFAFALANNTTVAMSNPNPTAAAICNQAHANGVRCYISIGGASGNVWPTTTANAQTLADNIANLLTYGGAQWD